MLDSLRRRLLPVNRLMRWHAYRGARVRGLGTSYGREWRSFPPDATKRHESWYFEPLKTNRGGLGVVHDPITNKGTGFSSAERDRLGIRGLVPPRRLSIEEQEAKLMKNFRKVSNNLEKHDFLNSLQDRNETLFFRLLINHIEELAPIVYTPTVGLACQHFGTIFRRSRGMYFSSADRGEMSTMVHNWPHDDIDVIVVTDGSRILGLGDLGANGMGIPIGKLALYVAAGGINPQRVLPVMLDCGTNNETLLRDPYYLGMQHPRLEGEEYRAMVDEFVNAVFGRWPRALMQFEDFATMHARDILDRYRDRFLCFNDDIQGTGAVTLSGLKSAVRSQGDGARLTDQRVVVVGAGSAGIGVASSIVDAMCREGLSEDEAYSRFWVLDDRGTLGTDRDVADLGPGQIPFVRVDERGNESLTDVIRRVKPTILLGLTGVGGAFPEEAVREMAKHQERPIVFPMSNPTSAAECTAEQAYEWTDGRCVFASGSPFDPVDVGHKTLYPSQCNNMFIFPGIGLGCAAVRAKRVTDDMLYAAASALTDSVSPEELRRGMVFPQVRNIREVSAKVAIAVAKSALNDGIARRIPPAQSLEAVVREEMWQPAYRPLMTRFNFLISRDRT